MTPCEFIDHIKAEVIDGGTSAYAQILEHSSTGDVTDKYWKQVLELYALLDEPSRTVVRMIMRQASIDAVSGVLGILDGVAVLNQHRENFALTYADGPPLNGSLQDTFLATFGT